MRIVAEPRLPRLSVVVPCYNEQDCIDQLYSRVVETCERTVGEEFEFILVNDCSRDGTWARIRELSAMDPRVVGVNLSRNHGHQLALSAGLSLAKGDRILILDADLQDPPELLPDMMAHMDAGADVVYGQRTARRGETVFKRVTASAFYRLLHRSVDVPIPVDTGDFRLISRRVLDLLNAMPERYRFIRGMVSWVGFKQVALPYERQERLAGETKYPFSKMVRFALDALTGFSIMPLRLASYLGFAFGFLSMLAVVYSLGSWMMGTTVPGWTSVMTLMLVLGSVQLLMIGVLGEYVGRLYMEAKGRPLFTIGEVVRQDEARIRTVERKPLATA